MASIGGGSGIVDLQEVFGYPPDNLEPRTNDVIKKSMPIVRFFPSTPTFQAGLDLFTLAPAWKAYTNLLLGNDFRSPNTGATGIQCAFLADNFPTDSFTNEYGENFLQKFTDVASEGAATLAQIMGKQTMSGAYDAFTQNLKKSDNAIAKTVGTGGQAFGSLVGAVHSAMTEIPGIGASVAGSTRVIDRLMAGSRIDFPMVWKSSGFQPSYSLTVRLYNPYPQNLEASKKFIIGPIAALMLLGVPRAQDSATFTWPFLHRITAPGIFDLDPGFISNITVVKGGDQQQISFQQNLAMVDVRIDVGSLFSTMLGGHKNITSRRPTVLKYAKSMMNGRAVNSRTKDNEKRYPGSTNSGRSKLDKRNTQIGGQTGIAGGGTGIDITERVGGIIYQTDRNKLTSPKRHEKSDDSIVGSVTGRVSDAATEAWDKVKDLNPFD